jgi:hypothetical protein
VPLSASLSDSFHSERIPIKGGREERTHGPLCSGVLRAQFASPLFSSVCSGAGGEPSFDPMAKQSILS